MAQVDKVSYLPLLFWFLVFFLIIYISVGFFFVPKTFAIIKIRTLYLRRLFLRFWKFYRQFKFNLRCMGQITLTEVALYSSAVLLSVYRLS